MSDPKTTPDPDQLRAEIEQTRADLGETVEALAAKTDVKGRAQRRIRADVEAAKERVVQATSAATDKVAQATSAASDKVTQATSAASDKVAQATSTATDKVTQATSTASDKVAGAKQQLAEASNHPRVRRALPAADLAIAGALAIAGTILVVRGRRA
ncbi:dsDNA-specific endonuclease/ATPase MutS2 [Actinoplanes octamycinicus]|uniref:DsDNA-specific endonuclease/ATPase MutS2 n=1 Tax=Actinoplanes octamycinicus TaxID=135948 RepID=A0A7W7H0Y9_9ACTN|nr:DUF3618 domain-containing protein [Actinoplanes octamycinicus]MBB4741908.1 dsDNA-specific endonuclease/ATPase MutS2 [Actinoplanes octamycinicus]GIE60671.1 hypothetical protein Aoc01nite_60730 [Actinoplanes octamycinicus]